ncbi:glycerophosphodiester phosphodiesterase family protein [Butyrivibrio sp. AE3004]|uniref:glycerophosphodiester phosphodiesterase family protein n=1 Tax=Butyrivibrio sp. AE3004 TaxID=1506994 RepID=UPI00068C2870|nr:glycerophosphodiester phosphodiesterase family protein [Butyrivibrio sp. AE3004]
MKKIFSVFFLSLCIFINIQSTVFAANIQNNVKSINHRGYNVIAPENTIPAFELSARMGFDYVEADISFTKDDMPVLLHDETINRTARLRNGKSVSKGNIYISDITYEEALKYDFGIWKNQKYKGTKIPTFEEFLLFCKRNRIHPYIEIKDNGKDYIKHIKRLVDMVKHIDLCTGVTWISFHYEYLECVKKLDSKARLGLLTACLPGTELKIIKQANSLQTGENEVFLDIMLSSVSNALITQCKKNNVPLEVWTIAKADEVVKLNPYISGITTNQIHYNDIYPRLPQPESEPSAASLKGFYSGLQITQPGDKLKVKWEKAEQIARYKVFVAYLGEEFVDIPVKTTHGNTAIIKKIDGEKFDNTRTMKIYVAAYDMENKLIGKTITAYVAGKRSSKYANPKNLKVRNSSISLAVGESVKVEAVTQKDNNELKYISDSNVPKYRYASTDSSVIKVDKNGKIFAKAEGTGLVYVYAKNGLSKKIKVNVFE